MDPVHSRFAPLLLGFFLTANTFLIPSVPASPRATDLIGALLAVWLLARWHRRGLPRGPLALLGVANIMPVVWLGWGLLEGQVPTIAQAGRWLVAIPWAITLMMVVQEAAARRRFVWGLVAGCGVGVGVIVLQYLGFDGPLRLVGLSTSDSTFHHYVYHQVRLPGLHGHHSPSSAVISLLAPLGLYLYFRDRARIWWPIICLLALLLGLNLTSTRSPLIVSALVIALGMVMARDLPRAVSLGALLVVGGLAFLAVFGPPGGAVRWSDMLAIEANAGERFRSNFSALELSAGHLLGMGVVGGKHAMYENCAIEATHNAFLQVSLFFGTPLALIFTLSLLRHALGLLQRVTDQRLLAGLLAVHMVGLFMFEEHLNNPTFIILVSWLVAAAVSPPPASTEPGDAS